MRLDRISIRRRTGDDRLQSQGNYLSVQLLEFWQWSASDLVSNATRGVLAEYIVALALGLDVSGVRDEWAPFDLMDGQGTRIEVKSAAYIQSWHQKSYSRISFSIRQSRSWDAGTNLLETESRRQSDVYVFALLAHKEQATLDPLNLDQWRFYVSRTSTLNEALGEQSTIGLTALDHLCGEGVGFSDLRGKFDHISNA